MDTDLAWAAGLFEGEGCFAMYRQEHRRYLRARLVMTDEEIVRRFAQVVGYGNVTGPRAAQRKGWSPFWAWDAASSDALLTFILLEPWLGTRRKARFHELWAERRVYEEEYGKKPKVTSERFQLIADYLKRAERYPEEFANEQ